MSSLRAPTARRVPIWRMRVETLKVARPKMPSAVIASSALVTLTRKIAMLRSSR